MMLVTNGGKSLSRSEMRGVVMFISLDDAMRDRRLRGQCVLFDLHGLWWSVPKELTLLEVEEAIRVEIDRRELQTFASHLGDIYRPTVD